MLDLHLEWENCHYRSRENEFLKNVMDENKCHMLTYLSVQPPIEG